MEQARSNWLAEQHSADAVIDDLALLPRLALPHGGVLAMALDEDVSEDTIRAALGDAYEVISIDHAPETHDRFVLARRVFVKKATKKAS
jgi:hypothetical protein